jgi:putative ABC transport system permease protein
MSGGEVEMGGHVVDPRIFALYGVRPLDRFFLDDHMQGIYRDVTRDAQFFAACAGIAILLACMGLVGIAVSTAERRTKEIGVRKAMGASSLRVVLLLLWRFSLPVLLANVIAWPVAWWAMRDWLNGFDARIQLGPEPFVLAGLVALVIALGTIAGHAFKVARSNPIHALRYE